MAILLTQARHSRQIRPPIYSTKQSKLRRKRVFRYATLYFVMLVVFVALIVGPIVAGKQIPKSAFDSLSKYYLVQPTGLNNDDTVGSSQTGTGATDYTGWGTRTRSTTSTTTAAPTSAAGAKMRLF
jgi:1,3-beta-glucan synthase